MKQTPDEILKVTKTYKELTDQITVRSNLEIKHFASVFVGAMPILTGTPILVNHNSSAGAIA